MYTTAPCSLPNSATPITADQINRQNARVARVGNRFVRGNQIMTAVIQSLTPPAPTGSCDDLTNTANLRIASVFPNAMISAPGTAAVSGDGYSVASVASSSGAAAAAPGSNTGAVVSGPISAAGADYPSSDVLATLSQLVPGNCNSAATMALLARRRGYQKPNSNAMMWGLVIGAAALAVLFGGDDRRA